MPACGGRVTIAPCVAERTPCSSHLVLRVKNSLPGPCLLAAFPSTFEAMLPVISALTAVLYLAATGLHLATVLSDRRGLRRGGFVATLAALAGHLALLWAVAVQLGAGALLEARGVVLLAGLVVTLIYIALSRRFELASLGSLVSPLSALSVMVWLVEPGGEAATEVALRSGTVLVRTHIVLALLGTAAFLIAFVLAVLYVIQERQLKQKRFANWARRLPSLGKLDRFIVHFVSVGFVVYTLSLLLGLFSQWRLVGLHLDFRSGLSLLTWAIYALIIQARITAGWRGRKAAQLIIVGAVCAIGVVMVYLARPGA